MAINATPAAKGRGIQLVRTDDSTPGVVKFYDRREADVNAAFVAQVDVEKLPHEALVRAARHGITQNILDASNKLEGDDRLAFIAKACDVVQHGGWASAPVDEAKARQNAIDALCKLGINAADAARMIDEKR